MEIRKEKITVEKEVNRYIALDGTVFDTLEECNLYEKDILSREITEKFRKLIIMEDFEIPGYSMFNDYNAYLLHFNSKSDFKAAADYFNLGYRSSEYDYMSWNENNYLYPCDVIVIETEGWFQDYGTKEDFMRHMDNLMVELRDAKHVG